MAAHIPSSHQASSPSAHQPFSLVFRLASSSVAVAGELQLRGWLRRAEEGDLVLRAAGGPHGLPQSAHGRSAAEALRGHQRAGHGTKPQEDHDHAGTLALASRGHADVKGGKMWQDLLDLECWFQFLWGHMGSYCMHLHALATLAITKTNLQLQEVFGIVPVGHASPRNL